MSVHARMPADDGEPGTDAGPDPAAEPAADPMTAEARSARRLELIFDLYRLVVWAVVAMLVYPVVFDFVGQPQITRWFEAHRWVKWAAAPIVFPLFVISMLEFRSRPRPSARTPERRTRDGARILDSSHIDPVLGMTDGPGLAWERGGWTIEVRRWRSRDGRRLVVRAITRSVSGFGFAAHSNGGVPGFLRAPLEAATGEIARGAIAADAEKRLGGSDGAAGSGPGLAEAGYLARPPIEIGAPEIDRIASVRTSDPGIVRELFRLPEVAEVLGEMPSTGPRWEWVLEPTRQPGIAEMRFTGPGAEVESERAKAIVALVHASLAQLTRAGVLRAD